MIDKNKLRAIFKKAQEAAKTQATAMNEARADDRFLKLKVGNTYHLRLLYYPVKNREKPFIELQTHSHFDPETRQYSKVVCPTSEHIDGSAGFDKCPICRAVSDFWKAAQNGKDPDAERMYRENRRSQESYAVVYVVKDSSAENSMSGQVKILKYGYEISKFLNANCLGIAARGEPEPDPEEVVGFEAFDLEKGRNLVIKVGKKDVRKEDGKIVSYPSYSLAFSQKYSSVPLTEDDLPRIFKELRFDEDFFKPVDSKAILNFYKNFVNPDAEEPEAVNDKPVKVKTSDLEKDDEEIDVEDEEETSSVDDEVEEEPTPKSESVKKAKKPADDDFDLDFPDFD